MAKNAEYINIDQSNVFRKRILETTVDVTQTLRFFEKYPKIRSKKIAQINKIKTLMKKITKEVNALETILPGIVERSKEGPTKQTKGKRLAKPAISKRESDLDLEIKEIKSKLSKLGI